MAVMALLQPSVTKEELTEPTVRMAVVLAELLTAALAAGADAKELSVMMVAVLLPLL
jgi:hypothetical protein